jgi:hypothetical protein
MGSGRPRYPTIRRADVAAVDLVQPDAGRARRVSRSDDRGQRAADNGDRLHAGAAGQLMFFIVIAAVFVLSVGLAVYSVI